MRLASLALIPLNLTISAGIFAFYVGIFIHTAFTEGRRNAEVD